MTQASAHDEILRTFDHFYWERTRSETLLAVAVNLDDRYVRVPERISSAVPRIIVL